METLIETFFGSVLAFLFGVGSGCSLGLVSTVLLAEAIGQNVFCALVPFALLHTAVFITALTMAIGMNLEIAELELENLIPGLLINLLLTTFNTLRHAQPLTIIGAVIMCFWVSGLRDSENEELCLGQWGMIIAITSELKTPKTAVLTIITGVAMMAFGSTEGQQEYGNIIAYILKFFLIMPLMIPFVITILANKIAQSVPVSDICATVLAVTAIVRLRAVMCFFTHIISQYVGLIKAIFKTVCVFGAIVIFSFNIALLLIFVGRLPHSFWGDDDNARSLQAMVKMLCWMSFFSEVIPSVRAAELGLQAADLKAVQTVLQMFAILDAVITLAVIYGIAVLVRVQPPVMKARGGLILAWTGTGATLALALAVWMVHGQAMLLKGLAGSVLISAFLFFIFKITVQSINIQPLCNNAPEVVKQLGSIYVATLVMGLGVALMPLWIGWACVVVGIFLVINTIQLIPILDQNIPEDIDEDEEELDETDEMRQRSVRVRVYLP